MNGSLQKKNGKYYVVARVMDQTGSVKQRWIPTGIPVAKGNIRKAQSELRRILAELEEQKTVYTDKVLLVDWIRKWLELKKTQVRVNTYEAYELYVNLHIEPYFKPLKLTLDKVTPQHIQDYYTRKLAGAGGAGGLSPNSLVKHHVVLKGALSEAVRKNLLPFNPADRVTLPAKKVFVGTAYSEEQANQLLALLEKEPLKSAVILGLYYGLRRSEVCGLRWRDIDFEAGQLSVRNTVVRTKTLIEHEETKSRASKRTMLLIPETVSYLKRLRATQMENRLLLGAGYAEGDHVCVWPDGRPVSPDYVSRAFGDFLDRKGLPRIRFHELRHTAGSLLLNEGRSAKQIQEYLGHEKVSTTLDIYGHLSVQGKKEAAQTMGSLLKMKAV